MKCTPYILFLVCLFSACTSVSEFEGYSKSSKGFHYKLLTIGESADNISIGDYITADISYSTLQDSLFFKGRRKIKIEEPVYKGAIEDCFTMLKDDESASFIISTEPFFKLTLESDLPPFLVGEEVMKINISIIDKQSAVEFQNEKQAFLNWIEDFGDYEKVLLKQFLLEEEIGIKPLSNGIYFIPLVQNAKTKIAEGDTITIHYEGKFLNGKYFDSTVRRKQPFQFVYGTEWQVIKGLEVGLSMMGEGDKAIFILPSELAFGNTGSSTGIIPAFTSLIYEVEVLRVARPNSK